jgi:histidine triad (HIT) family protein
MGSSKLIVHISFKNLTMALCSMDDCIFCKIAKGEIPSARIYENGRVLVFLDINPVSLGHALVIPKIHAADIFEMKEEDAKEIMAAAKKVADAAMKGLGAAGVNLLNANKKAASQEVFHFHMHVIPRYENDGVKMFPQVHYKENDLKGTAEKIKSAL